MSAFTDNEVISPRDAAMTLFDYCQRHDWAGHDPYDALNSKVLRTIPFLDNKIVRLAFIQGLKRSPINVRPLLAVPPTANPKALALFLNSALNLLELGEITDDALPQQLADKILALRSPGEEYWCWGYSFPWQTRTVLVPDGAPNLVCTVFVAEALLNLYDATGNVQLLNIATSAAEYVAGKLYFTEGGGVASFRYPLPTSKAKVHNANFLAAALLSRIYHHTQKNELREIALEAARYSVSKQNSDGSWYYGESPNQRWIDNFHTGYNLSGLRDIELFSGVDEFSERIRHGFEFYRANFFREDGVVRYFHDRTYPVDIHCIAQSILTLLEFGNNEDRNTDLVRAIYRWTMKQMRDRAGFFYYRLFPGFRIKTSYMRWSQAWMLLALSSLLQHEAGLNAATCYDEPAESLWA